MSKLSVMTYRLACTVLLGTSMHAISAQAEAPVKPMYSFSGFGTLGVVHSSENYAEFVSSIFKPEGAGYSSPLSAQVDSLFAAQLTASFTNQLTGVVQVIMEQQADNTVTPEIEWANLKYEFTPDLSIRVGRTILPTFLASSYRKVGYANPWARPPLEIYRLVPVSSNDGVDIAYRTQDGEATNIIQVLYGGKKSKTTNGSTAEAIDTWEIVDTLEYGALTLHATLHKVRVRRGNNPTDPVQLYTFGTSYDPGQWFVMGEIAMNRSVSQGHSDAWYLTGGYRIQNFTPYLTYSRLKQLTDPVFLPPAGQQNTSVGVRWDFYQGFDLKLQYERINLDPASPGLLTNTQPDFQPGSTFNVFTAVVDFVF